MVALLLAAVLGADAALPTSAVVVTRRTASSPTEARALAAAVSDALEAAGLTPSLPLDAAAAELKKLGMADASSCAGKKACVAELGKQLKVTWVFSVSVAKVDKDRSVGVELVRADDGSTADKDALILPPKAALTPDLLAAFAQRVKTLWAPKPADAPVVVETKPTPPPVDPLPPPPPPPQPVPERSRAASFVLGGVGLGALIASGVLLGLGLSARGALQQAVMTGPDGVRTSTLTFEDANRRNAAANLQLILSAVLGAVGLGLGTTALALW